VVNATQTWLFQANPKTFDIDGFLATRPSAFLWLVTRSGDRMRVGDRVFLWRAVAGEDEARSGVVAETEIADAPSEWPEDAASVPFWRSGDPAQPRLRVRLRTVRVAGSAKEVVQRKWALEDPVLRDMTILKAANATNFLLTDEQATRVGALWAKTGRTVHQLCSAAKAVLNRADPVPLSNGHSETAAFHHGDRAS
jgi:hypothetical protein